MGGVFRFLYSNILHYLKNKHVSRSNTHQYTISLETGIRGTNLQLRIKHYSAVRMSSRNPLFLSAI